MKKWINEYEVYKFWRYISHKISYIEYKEKLLDMGWIIYKIEAE